MRLTDDRYEAILRMESIDTLERKWPLWFLEALTRGIIYSANTAIPTIMMKRGRYAKDIAIKRGEIIKEETVWKRIKRFA